MNVLDYTYISFPLTRQETRVQNIITMLVDKTFNGLWNPENAIYLSRFSHESQGKKSMSITKSGIKSFSLYKDCPTPYDYLTCCCYQRYFLGLTTPYKALVKVFQGIVASNSSKCAHIQKMTDNIIGLHEFLLKSFTLYNYFLVFWGVQTSWYSGCKPIILFVIPEK
jgi:hypothetical protein